MFNSANRVAIVATRYGTLSRFALSDTDLGGISSKSEDFRTLRPRFSQLTNKFIKCRDSFP